MVLYSIGYVDYTNDFLSVSPELYSNLDTAIKIMNSEIKRLLGDVEGFDSIFETENTSKNDILIFKKRNIIEYIRESDNKGLFYNSKKYQNIAKFFINCHSEIRST